jgi:hypothetical protein
MLDPPFFQESPSVPCVDAQRLFQAKFQQPPPDFPEHFVVGVDDAAGRRVLGYVHYSRFEDVYLGGGLCVDTAALRSLTVAQRLAIKQAGSVSEMLMGTAKRFLHQRCVALFGYVGDAKARLVDFRAGYVETGRPFLIVNWCQALSETEKAAIIAKVAAVGPF